MLRLNPRNRTRGLSFCYSLKTLFDALPETCTKRILAVFHFDWVYIHIFLLEIFQQEFFFARDCNKCFDSRALSILTKEFWDLYNVVNTRDTMSALKTARYFVLPKKCFPRPHCFRTRVEMFLFVCLVLFSNCYREEHFAGSLGQVWKTLY